MSSRSVSPSPPRRKSERIEQMMADKEAKGEPGKNPPTKTEPETRPENVEDAEKEKFSKEEKGKGPGKGKGKNKPPQKNSPPMQPAPGTSGTGNQPPAPGTSGIGNQQSVSGTAGTSNQQQQTAGTSRPTPQQQAAAAATATNTNPEEDNEDDWEDVDESEAATSRKSRPRPEQTARPPPQQPARQQPAQQPARQQPAQQSARQPAQQSAQQTPTVQRKPTSGLTGKKKIIPYPDPVSDEADESRSPIQTRSRGPAIFDLSDLDTQLRLIRSAKALAKRNVVPESEMPRDANTVYDLEEVFDNDNADNVSEHSVLSDLEAHDSDMIGLKRLLTHVTKPIARLLDPELRDLPETRSRSIEHLRRINRGNVNRALKGEPTLMLQSYHINMLSRGLEQLQAEVSNMRQESHIKERSKIEKKGKIKPNPTYPLDNAVREDWLKAVAEMRAIMGVVDRSFSFKERPYDYLLEACASSNTIAAFYNLSRGQQIELILGSIPVLSHVYKQIKMFRTLEDIFELANMSSTTLFTKLELESLIESWHINLESFSTINESIGKLKCLITDAAEMELAPHMLYGEILKRLKREKLPGHVMRSLDEMTIRIGSETNMLVMHEYLLAALKPALGWKGRVTVSGGSGAIYKLEDAEPGSSYGPHSSSSVQSLPAALTDDQMMAWQNLVHQLTDASQNPTNSNANKNTSAKKKTERGRSKNKKSTGTGNKNKNSNTGNQRSKSRGGRLECVPPWPKNKKYLSRNGNQLTDELLRHFSGYCFRCGLNNHRATTCKFYDKAVILSLCTVCDRGFHEVCKNPRYAKTNANANQQKTNDSKGPVVTTPTEVKKLEEKMMKMLEERPNYPMWYPFPPPAMLMHKPVMPGVDSDDE